MINSNLWITIKEIKPSALKFQIISLTLFTICTRYFYIFAINAHMSFYDLHFSLIPQHNPPTFTVTSATALIVSSFHNIPRRK